MEEQTWQPPNWWYTNRRPIKDREYFENMSRIIFQAGLNWSVIDKKWESIKEAFENFSIEKVSKFTESDVGSLMKNEGVIRNKGKIQAIIQNAKRFKEIENQIGSFQKYLDSLDKSNNYAIVVKELSTKFKWLGASSARIFLHTVGEEIAH
jgi:DNA-3-methyladenine glycosylase I